MGSVNKRAVAESPWDFACSWYQPDEIHRAINTRRCQLTGGMKKPVPVDVTSRDFSEWLTHQYRLAMNKGIEIGERRAEFLDRLKE